MPECENDMEKVLISVNKETRERRETEKICVSFPLFHMRRVGFSLTWKNEKVGWKRHHIHKS